MFTEMTTGTQATQLAHTFDGTDEMKVAVKKLVRTTTNFIPKWIWELGVTVAN